MLVLKVHEGEVFFVYQKRKQTLPIYSNSKLDINSPKHCLCIRFGDCIQFVDDTGTVTLVLFNPYAPAKLILSDRLTSVIGYVVFLRYNGPDIIRPSGTSCDQTISHLSGKTVWPVLVTCRYVGKMVWNDVRRSKAQHNYLCWSLFCLDTLFYSNRFKSPIIS